MPKPNSDRRATERKHPWPMVRLGDVCEFSRGLTYSKSDEVQVSSNAVLRSNNVDLESGRLILDELKYIRDSIEIPTSKRVSKGAILMCTANGSKQHLGKVALIDDNYDYAFGGFMGLLTPNDSIDPRYLYWQLMSFEFKRLVTSLTDGANINNLKFADISQFTFPLPPLSVQREIVARLERELAAVEKMKKGFEALAETAKAEFKAELKEVFEEISRGGAETRRLGEVCELIKDGEHKTPRRVETYCGYYLLSARNVKDDNLSLEDVDYVDKEEFDRIARRCRPIAGDVLISCSGSVGRVCVAGDASYVMVRSAAMVRASRFDSRFLMFMLQSDLLQKQIAKLQRQAAQANLFLGAIAELNVFVPPLSAQREVVARLDGAKAKAEKLEAKAREGVAVCETMRKAILKEAFE